MALSGNLADRANVYDQCGVVVHPSVRETSGARRASNSDSLYGDLRERQLGEKDNERSTLPHSPRIDWQRMEWRQMGAGSERGEGGQWRLTRMSCQARNYNAEQWDANAHARSCIYS